MERIRTLSLGNTRRDFRRTATTEELVLLLFADAVLADASINTRGGGARYQGEHLRIWMIWRKGSRMKLVTRHAMTEACNSADDWDGEACRKFLFRFEIQLLLPIQKNLVRDRNTIRGSICYLHFVFLKYSPHAEGFFQQFYDLSGLIQLSLSNLCVTDHTMYTNWKLREGWGERKWREEKSHYVLSLFVRFFFSLYWEFY